MAGILHQQINLKKTAPDTYNAGWHQDWTVASSKLLLTPYLVLLKLNGMSG